MSASDRSVWRAVWRATMPESLAFLLPAAAISVGIGYQAFGAGRSLAWFGDVFSLWLPLLTFLCLTPVFAGRDWRGVRSDPGDMATAQAVFSGVAAACLGFALGANMVASVLGDGWPGVTAGLRRGLAAITVIGLVAVLYRLTSSMRSMYLWSQDVATTALAIDTQLVRARVSALEARMNPHFLFNALNTVASLVRTDGPRARRTAAHLSDLLRRTLDRGGSPTTTVRDEVAFVGDYLEIERERFGSRLAVSYDIADTTLDLQIPSMSLQPLVENAVKHAVATRIEGGRITVSARLLPDRDTVRLAVDDDGPGFAPGSADGTGLGNLRARLSSLYNERAVVMIDSRHTGARVSIEIPVTE